MREIALLTKTVFVCFFFLQLAPLLVLVGDLGRVPATKLLMVHSKVTNTSGIN